MSDEFDRAIPILRKQGLEMHAMGGCVECDGCKPETKRNIWWQFGFGDSFDLDAIS